MRLLVLLVLTWSNAFASERSVEDISLYCNKYEYIVHNLKNDYNERPFSQSETVLTLKGGDNVTGRSIVFVNPDTKSTTTVFKVSKDETSIGCVITAGVMFGPPDEEEYTAFNDDIKL